MSIDLDTDDWLGCPSPLEMYQHQCALLEDELIQTEAMLRKARANVAGLVQMNDLLATGKTTAEAKLRYFEAELSRTNIQSSEMAKEIMGLKMIASQNEHLFRENQRLLMELTNLTEPSA